MEFTREFVIPAALSAMFDRIFSVLLDNIPFPWSAGAQDAHRRRLEWLVGSIASAVEEAEGRNSDNLNLVAQVKVLTEAMYRGCFALDFTGRKKAGDDSETTKGGRSLALPSPFNAAKRVRLILGGDDGAARIASVVEELEALKKNCMREFIQLMQGYPRGRNKVQPPVATTLYMDRRVFGRHAEKERVVAFLLQPAPSSGLSALAVVGGFQVGKTTLVKHVCDDERVRDHFKHVVWFNYKVVMKAGRQPGQSIIDDYRRAQYAAGVRCILNELRFHSDRSLLLFEDALFIDNSAWVELVASTSKLLADGSKLLFTCHNIFASRITGTMELLMLRPPREEEYWYYFKSFAFDSADPRDHPRIATVGRDISHYLLLKSESLFLDARVLGYLLRANFNIQFWGKVLEAIVRCRGQRDEPHIAILVDIQPFSRWIDFF